MNGTVFFLCYNTHNSRQCFAAVIKINTDYAKRRRNIGKYGYGIYAKNHMFRIDNGKIIPVLHPDETALSDLIGYEREKKIILDNTKALLEGRAAANIGLRGRGRGGIVWAWTYPPFAKNT